MLLLFTYNCNYLTVYYNSEIYYYKILMNGSILLGVKSLISSISLIYTENSLIYPPFSSCSELDINK